MKNVYYGKSTGYDFILVCDSENLYCNIWSEYEIPGLSYMGATELYELMAGAEFDPNHGEGGFNHKLEDIENEEGVELYTISEIVKIRKEEEQEND